MLAFEPVKEHKLENLCNELLTVVSSAKVNHSASAACDECSGSSHHELVVARPREASSEAVTLAAG